jgi:hypothetical protein
MKNKYRSSKPLRPVISIFGASKEEAKYNLVVRKVSNGSVVVDERRQEAPMNQVDMNIDT